MGVQTILVDAEHLVRRRCVKVFLDMIILSLMKSSVLSGYDVIKIVYEKFGILLRPGNVYPILNSLEDRNMIHKKNVERKKIYGLTDDGALYINLLFNEYEKMYSQMRLDFSQL
ncbi:MAG: PadR family transcriptional regulator [Nitrososphaerales archaeon]